jgi:CHAD domain-containing protein
MSTFAAVLPDSYPRLREELKWVGQELGHVRDLDVQILELEDVRRSAGWEQGVALSPLLTQLQRSHGEARSSLLTALSSARYDTLVTEMVVALGQEPTPATDEASLPIGDFAPDVIRRRFRQFRREAAGLEPESPAPAFHAARIRGKRLRYTLEFFASLYTRQARRLIAAMVEAQDLLGEHQDCYVAIERLQEIGRLQGRELPPATLLFMGESIERSRSRAGALRQRWPGTYRLIRKRWRRFKRELARAQPEAGPDSRENLSTDTAPRPPGWRASLSLLTRWRGRHPGA